MDFDYIKTYYKVPTETFREVIVNGRKGVIAKAINQYIGVVFYDDKKRNSLPCHPTYKVEYLDTFNYKIPKPKNHKSKQRYNHYLSLDSNMTFFEYIKSSYCLK